MQTHQENQKFAISFGVVAVIAIASAVMVIQMYFPEQTGAANPSTGTTIRGSTEPEMKISPDGSSISRMPVQENSNPETIVSDVSPSIGMPVPGSNVPEMVVSPTPQEVN